MLRVILVPPVMYQTIMEHVSLTTLVAKQQRLQACLTVTLIQPTYPAEHVGINIRHHPQCVSKWILVPLQEIMTQKFMLITTALEVRLDIMMITQIAGVEVRSTI